MISKLKELKLKLISIQFLSYPLSRLSYLELRKLLQQMSGALIQINILLATKERLIRGS
jgi:hypothetical protein